ncbi:MAG: glycosyl transferase family 1 [Candidatus Rokubacteria bacterium 13_1_40CM_68_15]|nr:MAG: glycosyl transferase family 1 [Candidatus Rokubacteria bacterium 13_1_40CM_68_15]
MRILVVHNYYQEAGGEDEVFRAEVALLREHGHEVSTLTTENGAVHGLRSLLAARDAVWSVGFQRRLRECLRQTRPDVVHFHNTFFRVSPAAYYACRDAGVPVVQTLHNYRLVCPSATFYRGGRACEDCIGRTVALPGIRHGCYRSSRGQTAVVAGMLTAHRWLGTWQQSVDAYIAMTEFARAKFIAGGLPAEKIAIKPNFCPVDPGIGHGAGGYALFVGRLSPEKGVETLMSAWRRLGGTVPLYVVGDGPLGPVVEEFVGKTERCHWLGRQPKEKVLALMREAQLLVLPSECYEMFPLVLAEASAAGLPVIGSRHGSIGAIIDDGRTGLHVRPGAPDDLASKVEWAFSHPRELAAMRTNARAAFEARYTPDVNYELLMGIYDRARNGAVV